ncbi:MAG: hypothetical protein HZA34_02335 [Candidatus Pacebacteria bacterium]|nr:hypothetical protein [Candidatus Paceibacterota bacterium]
MSTNEADGTRHELDGVGLGQVGNGTLRIRHSIDTRVIEPVLPINKENFNDRWRLFSEAFEQAKQGVVIKSPQANRVLTGDAMLIARKFGRDVLDKAVDEKMIIIG